MTGVRRSALSLLTATAGLGAVLFGLAAVDPRVRDEIAATLRSNVTSTHLASVGDTVQRLGWIVAEAIRDQSIDHAPLVIFGVAATILVFFMLRT